MPGQRGDYGTRGGSSHRRTTVTALPTSTEPTSGVAGDLEAACNVAFAEMNWLRSSDEIVKQLIRTYAKLIDGPEGGYMATKMGPHMLDALKQIGATPYTRMMLFGAEKTVSGKLAELREKRTG
jgi:hypothetical protein